MTSQLNLQSPAVRTNKLTNQKTICSHTIVYRHKNLLSMVLYFTECRKPFINGSVLYRVKETFYQWFCTLQSGETFYQWFCTLQSEGNLLSMVLYFTEWRNLLSMVLYLS